jgi:hypothetical protein
MPNLARANRRERKHWKTAHRMQIHSAHLRLPSSAEQQRIPRAVLAMLGARPKRHHRQ